MSRRPVSSTTSAASSPPPAAAADRPDRTATLLDSADDAEDVIQFWEENPTSGRWEYIERFDVPDVRAIGIEEFAVQHYGGGKYKAGIRGRRSGVYGQSVVFWIAGARKSDHERTAQRPAAATAAAAPTPAAPSNNPPAWLEKILVPIGVTFATAAGGFLAKKLLEEKPTDPVLLELIKQMGKRGDGPAAAPVDHVTLMNQLLELQDRLAERAQGGTGSAGGDPIVAAIDRGVPQVVGLFKRKLELDEERMRRGITVPQPHALEAPAAGAPTSTGDPLIDLLQSVPMPARQFLYSAALRGAEPGVYAELVLQQLSDDDYAAMPALLERADFVDVLIRVTPSYGAYRAWFVALVDAMRDSLSGVPAELSEESGRERAGTHSGDAAADPDASKGAA